MSGAVKGSGTEGDPWNRTTLRASPNARNNRMPAP